MHKVAILAFVLTIGSAEELAIASLPRQTAQTFTVHGEVETETDANAAQGCASAASAGDGMDAGGSATQGAVAGCAGAAAHTTGFAYDARHRLITKTWPTVGTETAQAHWTWDADDNEASHTTPNGALITSSHDALNRRTDEAIDTVAAGQVSATHWAFDGNANPTAIVETLLSAGERSETRRYDAFDRLEAVTDSYGKTLGYGYDPVGNRTRLTDAEGEITEYTYDALNHNRKVTVPGQGITAQTWLPSGRLETIARPNGSTTTQAYDAAGRLETIHHSNPGGVIAQLRYRYDLNGNRIEQKETNGAVTENSEQTTGYEYDRADRLVTVREPARTLTYTLDAVGNRTTETVTNASAVLVSQSTLSYDERDRLTERSDPVQGLVINQTWDADGNRTGQTINGEARTFTYDARDRLVTLEQPGAPPLAFDYDSHGLRTKKAQGPAETRYQYDQSSLIAETNAIGNTTSRLHYGATQLLARTEAGSTPSQRHYLLDALNSPIVLTNQDGSISARTKYDAFGEILAQQGTAGQLITPNPNAATATLLTSDQQPIGFTGYQKDQESGLYYARARYYDPTVARFTTEDPEAGKAEMPPSLHRYLYAYANPTVYVDPTGRYAEAGHYYTTYYVALRVGYSDEQAQKLAFYSQLPDEVDRLDAIGVQADSVLGEWGIGAVNAWLSATPSVVPLSVAPTAATRTRDEVQVGFHSLVGSTGREQTALTLAAMRNASDDLNTTGLLIHRLGDTFSHCPNRGECFDTGWGHGGEGTTPDVIQTAPKDYLAYVETLTAALAEQRGASADEVKQLRESVRAELQDVADIATFDARPAIPAWKPGGWMDSPPPPVYDAMIAKPRQRSDDELQSRSQAMLREKLSRQGAEVQYAPESLPGGFDEYDVYVPHFQTARTLDQALADFAVSSGRMMSAQEAQAALAKVRKLIEAQRADARSEPVVIVEGRSNYPAAKVQE